MEAATMPAPDRSLAQRHAALREANRIRCVRAEFKRKLKAHMQPWALGQVRQIVLEPPHDFATMYVHDLLLAVPKWGRTKVNRTMVRCRISPSKTLGGLSERQRDELAGALFSG